MADTIVQNAHELEEEAVEGKQDQQPQFHRDPSSLVFSERVHPPQRVGSPRENPKSRGFSGSIICKRKFQASGFFSARARAAEAATGYNERGPQRPYCFFFL